VRQRHGAVDFRNDPDLEIRKFCNLMDDGYITEQERDEAVRLIRERDIPIDTIKPVRTFKQ
jgi:hypothetical protein